MTTRAGAPPQGSRVPAGAGRATAAPAASSSAKASPATAAGPCRVLTVGHSTRPIEEFVALLRSHGVTHLVDVRTVPRSRRNPQYGIDVLPGLLAAAGIGYEHAPGLGGFRRTSPASPNGAWRNLSFRGYADYMQSAEFAASLGHLITLAAARRVAIMCAEAVPWRCHRSLIADALLVHGVGSCEIAGPARLQPHALTPFAAVDGRSITYPAEAGAATPAGRPTAGPASGHR